jgi:dCMP deaminase
LPRHGGSATPGSEQGTAGVRLLLYLPVLHAGYQALLDRYPDAEVLLLGSGFAERFPVLRKEIRALAAEQAAAYLGALGRRVRVVRPETLGDALGSGPVVAPDEELLRDVLAGHPGPVRFERTFLRWDRPKSLDPEPVEGTPSIGIEALDEALIGLLHTEAGRSSDWWRQVGAVAARDGAILYSAHNAHQPSEYSPYLDGDPRNDFSRGMRIDLSTALHAEAGVVAKAAADGVALRGADLYVTTFPCPGCARLVAAAGFARCYFLDPYAVLHGDHVLRAAGVALIRVVS